MSKYDTFAALHVPGDPLVLFNIWDAGSAKAVAAAGAKAIATGSYGVAEAPLWKGDWPKIDVAYFNGVTKVLNGEMTPQEFADTICQEADLYFE